MPLSESESQSRGCSKDGSGWCTVRLFAFLKSRWQLEANIIFLAISSIKSLDHPLLFPRACLKITMQSMKMYRLGAIINISILNRTSIPFCRFKPIPNTFILSKLKRFIQNLNQ